MSSPRPFTGSSRSIACLGSRSNATALGPGAGEEITILGQSVQVDVKHLKLASGRFYQFTAIDEATRYGVLKIYCSQ